MRTRERHLFLAITAFPTKTWVRCVNCGEMIHVEGCDLHDYTCQTCSHRHESPQADDFDNVITGLSDEQPVIKHRATPEERI